MHIHCIVTVRQQGTRHKFLLGVDTFAVLAQHLLPYTALFHKEKFRRTAGMMRWCYVAAAGGTAAVPLAFGGGGRNKGMYVYDHELVLPLPP